jgi:outer membrane protein OmpA-like peptidoglycan-associated protein
MGNMKHGMVVITIVASLATAPALASVDGPSEAEKRRLGIGVIATGVAGALLAGPPGAMAGLALGGIGVEHHLVSKRATALEAHGSDLELQRQSLLSERKSMQARLAELDRLLAHERELSAGSADDAARLAVGLEFAVSFRTGSAIPPAGADEGLAALARLVAAVPSLALHLDGYADPRGSDTFNEQLSLGRAEAIRDRLIEAGVAPERIHVSAHGAVGEQADAADLDGWALQRRVSIRIEQHEGRLAATP